MPNYVLSFLVAVVAALVAVPVVSKLAELTGAMDAPDERKVHKRPVPRIGGVAIYAAFMVSFAVTIELSSLPEEIAMGLQGLAIGATLIIIVGLVDDYFDLPAKVKLLGQIAAACIAVIGFDVRIDFITDPFGDYFYLEFLAVPITVFWMVGLTNTVNLIDGLDGLAAGVASIAAVTIFIISLQDGLFVIACLTAAIAGAAIGFLKYNFNPASIFMGDTGSMFLGYMLAGISVIGAVKSTATIALIIPVLALGVPIMDTSFAIIRRYMGGMPIFKPDKGHMHHRLLDMGFTHRQAVLLMYVISAFLGMSAIILNQVSGAVAVAVVAVVVVLVFAGARKLGIFSIKKIE